MTHYDGFNIRHSIAASVFAVLLSITTLFAVASPIASAQNSVRTAQVVVPLA